MFKKLHTYDVKTYMIQRYIKNKGKFIYHDDANIDYQTKKYRLLTYIWYLNDVDEGGETSFRYQDLKVKPDKGGVVVFPATWTYPHEALVPRSSDKLILSSFLVCQPPFHVHEDH
jgi:hypothetical protein